MKKSEKIDYELRMAKNKIEQLVEKTKNNSDDYNVTGMMAEQDIFVMLKKACTIMRRTLEAVTSDYILTRYDINKINSYIDNIKRYLNTETYAIDPILINCGVRTDKYGMSREVTIEDAVNEYRLKIADIINYIDTQKIRIENFGVRKRRDTWRIWVPISISALSLLVSALALLVSILK